MLEQRPDRLVDGAAPVVLAEARGGDDERAAVAGAVGQPRPGLAPLASHVVEGPPGGDRPGQPGRDDDEHDEQPGRAHGQAHRERPSARAPPGRGRARARDRSASGSRTRGSALWMLRNATRGPSSRACATGASGEDTGPRCGTPRSDDTEAEGDEEEAALRHPAQRESRPGTRPATRAVARTRSGPVATAYPAGHHSPPEVTTNPSQWVVPRATSRRSISRTTSAARSIQSEERRRPAAEQDERPEPPQAGRGDEAGPPPRHGVAPPRAAGQQPQPGRHGGEDRRGRVDPAAPEHREGRERGRPARADPAPASRARPGRRIAGARSTGSASDDSPPTVESTRGLSV